MTQFKEMWIPCDESQYPEVKSLLKGMGYEIQGSELSTTVLYQGLVTHSSGICFALEGNIHSFPTVTHDELRAMAKPEPTQPDNLAALETLFANFIEAVAEMRAAQRKYENTPRTFRPEVLGIRLKHEREVDAMINDVTRKP